MKDQYLPVKYMCDQLLSAEEWTKVFDALRVPKLENLNRSTILTGAAIERLASTKGLRSIANKLQLNVNDSITITIIESASHDGGAILRIESNPPLPPAWAESVLTFLTGSRRAEAAIGDMNERFTRECTEVGLSRARLRYSVRTMRSVWPLLKRMFVQLGVWAAVISAVKRYFAG